MNTRTADDPKLMRLVEQQLRNWELARDQRQFQKLQEGSHVADFICISREVGAGGNEIGLRLAERLGWPAFDREVLHVMADDDALREPIYASMDERDVSWLEETLRASMQPEFGRNDYFHRLKKTILSLVRQGSAVFIGRGADLILPRDAGLRVRIVAPLEMRSRRFAERHGISMEDARNGVERLDAERALFIRRHFHVDVREPGRYDLTINLARLTLKDAAQLIEQAFTMLRTDKKAS
jgi:cytidylate kinase